MSENGSEIGWSGVGAVPTTVAATGGSAFAYTENGGRLSIGGNLTISSGVATTYGVLGRFALARRGEFVAPAKANHFLPALNAAWRDAAHDGADVVILAL